ncbi:MAG TPA: Mth938-like domain-containing protein [Xanthomonadaceae bacterium]|nr:Mth938-like domain-containing protein [Xanthomonadaceae bacterium]
MPFILQPPDHAYAVRSVRDDGIVVNEQTIASSFYLSPDTLHEGWAPVSIDTLKPDDLAGPLSLDPEVILLGTGARQRFPSALVMATCLQRGVGIEAMDNHAAARTFSVLANEGRRVVVAFLLGSDP